MVGEQVPLDQLMSFKSLFRVDTGRRVFAFLLKEFAQVVRPPCPLLVILLE